jgi:putative membrane protein
MLQFFARYTVKAVVYYALLLAFMAIGLLSGTPVSLIWAALILAGVNTLIRPLLVTVALPFNILLFGIASVFANLLALVIASAIAGGALTAGFWIMLLLALVIMLADDGIRRIRKAVRLKRAES